MVNSMIFLPTPTDPRTPLSKILHGAQSIGKDVGTVTNRLARMAVAKSNDNMRFPKEESEGLYLFIHGLWGHPTDWNLYRDRTASQYTFAAPHVYNKGNAPLERAAEPILRMVKEYLQEHPGKPVSIIGTSNGSRIATYIENNLTAEELRGTSLKVVSIAGVLGGTKVVNRLGPLLRIVRLNSKLIEELKWQSSVATNLMDEWQKKQKLWQERNVDVQHLFIATREDALVRPIKSSLPMNSSHKIYHGEAHMSVVDAALNDVFDWLNKC